MNISYKILKSLTLLLGLETNFGIGDKHYIFRGGNFNLGTHPCSQKPAFTPALKK
jgi:hypothetical protein